MPVARMTARPISLRVRGRTSATSGFPPRRSSRDTFPSLGTATPDRRQWCPGRYPYTPVHRDRITHPQKSYLYFRPVSGGGGDGDGDTSLTQGIGHMNLVRLRRYHERITIPRRSSFVSGRRHPSRCPL